MATVAKSPMVRKSFFATLYDQSGVLATLDDGVIYFFSDTGDIVEYEPEMSPWVTILGEVGASECQRVLDTMHGGYAAICCSRQEGVS